jgi:hypothetical protein
MSFIMSYTDNGGTVHSDSFWVLHRVSIDRLGLTGLMIYHGWHSVADYPDQSSIIGEHTYTINNPVAYQASFFEGELSLQPYSFYSLLDHSLSDLDAFFDSAIEYADLSINRLSVGVPEATSPDIFSPHHVFLEFYNSMSGLDDTTGVTIEVNGSPATIIGTTLTADNKGVWYELFADVDAGDEVTFAYDGSGTVNESSTVLPLWPINTRSVLNEVGLIFDFRSRHGSMWFAIDF